MQEDAHGVHADAFGPAKFAIDRDGVKGVGLPHFKLVDGGGRKKIRADRPRLLGVPRIGLCFRPALLGMNRGNEREQEGERKKQAVRLVQAETHRTP